MSKLGIQRTDLEFRQGFNGIFVIPTQEQIKEFVDKGSNVVVGKRVMRDTENHDSIKGVSSRNTTIIEGEIFSKIPDEKDLFYSRDIENSDIIFRTNDDLKPYPMNRFQMDSAGNFWIQLENDDFLWLSIEHSSDIPDLRTEITGCCDVALGMPTFLHPSKPQNDPSKNQVGLLSAELQYKPNSPENDLEFKKKSFELAMRGGLGQLGDCPESYILSPQNTYAVVGRLRLQIYTLGKIIENEQKELKDGEESEFLGLAKSYYFGLVGCLLEGFKNKGQISIPWEDLRSINELGQIVLEPSHFISIFPLHSATDPAQVAYIIQILLDAEKIGKVLTYEEFGDLLQGRLRVNSEDLEKIEKIEGARARVEEWFPNDLEALSMIFNIYKGNTISISNIELLEKEGTIGICDDILKLKSHLTSIFDDNLEREKRWLESANPTLDNSSPRDIILEEGIERILQLLEQY